MDAWNGSFAQSQLEKFGWSSGDGLGKDRHGNTKHIAVSKKNDKKGLGVGQEQWEFAWWDHLYNKSASSVKVEKDTEENRVKVVTTSKGSDSRRTRTGLISGERPTGKRVSSPETSKSVATMSAMAGERNMVESVQEVQTSMAQKIAAGVLYSSFVKSSSGDYDASKISTPAESNTSPNDSSSDDDDVKDYSIKVTDSELFAACEGRTARKGGRGLTEQKGKLSRVMTEYLPVKSEAESDGETAKRKREADGEDQIKERKKAKKEKKDKKEKMGKKEKKKKEKKEKKDKKERNKDKKEKESNAKKEKKATKDKAKENIRIKDVETRIKKEKKAKKVKEDKD